jgi:TolA-binding protein
MPSHLLRALAGLTAAALVVSALPASAQLGIDLVPDEKKQQEKKPEPKKRPPAPTTLPELDIGAAGAKKGEAARRMADANQVFQRGDFETAALAYDAILREPALSEGHDEARYQLAKSLYRLGLYHASLAQLDLILQRGPQGTKYFHNALEWLFQVGKKTVNEEVIVNEVARYANGAFPPSSQDAFTYLLARYSYERGHALDDAGRPAEAKKAYDEVRRLTVQIRPEAGARPPPHPAGDEPRLDEADVYARARFLDGLVQYAQGNGQSAVESFKEVVRLTNPKRGRAPDPRVRELAFLQLARIHYEHKQNRYAIFYYDKMPWGGDSWLEGLWESSYAHYRIGDYEKALGNLLTLQSPYFRDAWFPESWILKAIIYYENCRYPEARGILDEFHGGYEGLLGELERLTARRSQPAAFYDLLEDAEKGRATGSAYLSRILKVALTDRDVKRLHDTILEVEGEMDRGIGGRREAFRGSALAKDLRAQLEAERGRLVDEAGARARAKLEYERDALRELLQQALRIKIEVSRQEREALEGALTRGGQVDVLKDYRYSTAVSDEHLYWPYDGEFWRDELGTYTYTLTKGCRDIAAREAR